MHTKICYLLICLLTLIEVEGQQTNNNLIGKWKLTSITFSGGITFDKDSLTSSYKQFFQKQKQQVYKGKISENDSLFIQYQFEKAVNDVSKMFIQFKKNNIYVTNHYDNGELTDKTESGRYNYNKSTRTINSYKASSKRLVAKYKVISLTEDLLIMKTTDGTIMKCKRTLE